MSNMFGSINIIQRGLDFHQSRQAVLVSNIAHVDTPGFQAKDMKRTSEDMNAGSFGAQLGVAVAKTSPGHMNTMGVKGSEGRPIGEIVNSGGARKPGDVNGVSLDREASKAAANQIRYDVLANLVSSSLAGLHEAAGDFK